MLTAAADHCLAAAYRGECPGVDPDALMRWRFGELYTQVLQLRCSTQAGKSAARAADAR